MRTSLDLTLVCLKYDLNCKTEHGLGGDFKKVSRGKWGCGDGELCKVRGPRRINQKNLKSIVSKPSNQTTLKSNFKNMIDEMIITK